MEKRKHWWAKLDKYKVVEIRKRHKTGESQNALAKAFCVSQPTIGQIVHNDTWRHVKCV